MKDKPMKHEDGFEWPPGESPPDDRELQAAREHADAVAHMLEGGGVGEDDLVALAGMIHHSTHEASLDVERRGRLLDEVLASQVVKRKSWSMAPLLALAAAVLLAMGVSLGVALQQGDHRAPSRRVAGSSRPLPQRMLSRSSDGLLGKPIVDRAGASRRLDRVYASRLSGYRSLRMHHWRSP